MERLLKKAVAVSDQSEVYSQEQTVDRVSFENGELKDIESRRLSGVSLRLIRDERLGVAFTRNLLNPEALLQNALETLRGEVEARYRLPEPFSPPEDRAYDPAIEALSGTRMVEEGRRIIGILSE